MPITKKNKLDYWGNSSPKCPHCDFEIDISRFDLYHLYDEGKPHEINCPKCEKLIKVNSTVEWTFETSIT